MGQTTDYYDVRHFVFARDKYICQVCKKSKNKILNTHHIVFTSEGGTNRSDNLITVCTDCHKSENHKKGGISHNWMLEGKKVKHYKAPTFMNLVRKRFYQYFKNRNVTYGSTIKLKRKTLNLEKSHYKDAIARKGYKSPNISQKINSKNTKQIEDKKFGIFCLNDKVRNFERIGFISGFSGKTVYIKDTENNYITIPNKNYK